MYILLNFKLYTEIEREQFQKHKLEVLEENEIENKQRIRVSRTNMSLTAAKSH